MSPEMKFELFSVVYYMFRRKDNGRKLPVFEHAFGPCRDSLINQIMQLDAFELMTVAFVWYLSSSHPRRDGSSDVLHAAMLRSFFDSDMFEETEWSFDSADDDSIQPVYKLRFTSSQRDRKMHTALGRFLGISLRFSNLRKFLSQFIFAPSPTASIFETIFFNSYYVRNGVYDVIPTNILEHLFSNGQQLVNALRAN